MATPRPMIRTALALAFATLILSSEAFAAPGDKVFTVGNYPVEAEAASAVAAKDKAMTDGRDAAFRSLLKRLVPVTAYNQLTRIKGTKTADLLDGVRIRSEQNSPTRYIASLDYSFQADAVRGLLQSQGVPFVADQAPEVLLIPVTQTGQTYAPAGGTWLQVWKDLDLENTLSPARITALKPEVHPDTIQLMLQGTGEADRILANEYKSDKVVLAIAEIDIAGKLINVTLAGRDAVGPLSWTRAYRVQDGDTGYALDLAGVVSLGVLEGRWKVMKTGPGGTAFGADVLQIDVAFQSQDEWNDIRGRLLDIDGVDNVNIAALTARSAEMGLTYPGGGLALASLLSQRGMKMVQNGGRWSLSPAY